MFDESLNQLAHTPVLLVTTDFDGTLAPIVPEPDMAEAAPRAQRAIATLARQPHTRVAVISGRALGDLEARLRPTEPSILLVGSHGSEFEPELAGRLSPEQQALRQQVHDLVEAAAEDMPGVLTEHKDASSSLHYRTAERDVAASALWRLWRLRRALPDGVTLRRGKKVIELSVLDAHKGQAIEQLRAELGATGVLYVGDDRTDEDAFRSLGVDDVTVKVGDGPTSARFRVPGPPEVADLLARLADMRARALRETASMPITDLGFLSDQRTGALVTPHGEVCWMCPERFDRPSIFASILGGPTAGRFRVQPADTTDRGHQRYRGDSLVLETRWPSLLLTDYLDPAAAARGGTVLVREVTPLQPGVRCEIEFAPRPDFARLDTLLEQENGRLRLKGGRETLELEAPDVDFRLERRGRADVALATVTLNAPLRLVLRCGRRAGASRAADAVADEWDRAQADLELPERWSDHVRRSVSVLRGLIYRPSGAVIAALTTSLPEAIGAGRNWDYRYCWLRDAAYACDALLRLGSLDETADFLRWLEDVVEGSTPEDLQPLYGVEGEANLTEAEVGTLIGYRGSQPVRIGNQAAEQLQIDVYGAIVDLACTYAEMGGPISDDIWRLVSDMVRAVAYRWTEPDTGIWEHRHLLRHHVHSKVMCWVAADRAAALAHMHGHPDGASWAALADTIAAQVLERGWSERAGAFTVAYDSDDLDAAALVLLLSGLLSPSDPRAVATVEAVEDRLCVGSTVYRYRYDDGLPGDEGGFHICTSWLVDCLALIGRQADAERLFTHVIGAAGATGLLSEQVDPVTGASLGNVPQAYSHTGVIWNALTLTRAARSRVRRMTEAKGGR